MPKDVILTPEGLANLKAELDHLTTTRRREVAARIKEAREFGDISENAEYDDAKNEQAMLEARIASLEEKLRSATVIDQSDLGTDRSGSARSSTSRTTAASRPSTRSSARPRPAPARRSSPTSPRSARRCSAASAVRRSSITTPKGERRLKITKIDVESK